MAPCNTYEGMLFDINMPGYRVTFPPYRARVQDHGEHFIHACTTCQLAEFSAILPAELKKIVFMIFDVTVVFYI